MAGVFHLLDICSEVEGELSIFLAAENDGAGFVTNVAILGLVETDTEAGNGPPDYS